MSIAYPQAIRRVGKVHPAVLDAARIIQDNGWRVTSIFRPSGITHPRGIALDCAPLVYVEGGFGPITARIVHDLVKSHLQQQNWLSVAELDHIHLQLYDFDAIGINTSKGTQIQRI